MSKATGFDRASEIMANSRRSKLKPHYRVKLFLAGGGVIRLATWNEPKGDVYDLDYDDLIDDPDYGDTLGKVDWDQVAAVTWRRSR